MSSNSTPIKVIVTMGGTEERLDVGRFIGMETHDDPGHHLALAFHAMRADVHAISSLRRVRETGLSGTLGGGEGNEFLVTTYQTGKELHAALGKKIASVQPDVVVLAAFTDEWELASASDYPSGPGFREFSAQWMRGKRHAYGIRAACPPGTTVVGLAATVGATRADLVAKARRMMAEDGLDLVLACERSPWRARRRCTLLVTPEGGVIPLSGVADEFSPVVADFVMKRHRTSPVVIHCDPDVSVPERNVETSREIVQLLALAHDTNAYSGTSGNLSVRASRAGDVYVSPTGVEKRTIVPDDLVYVQRDPTEGGLGFPEDHRPSIDTNMQVEIYRHFPQIESILHVHADAGLFLTDAVTRFPYPCGTREEAEDVIATISAIGRPSAPFSIELIHHGFMLGLETSGSIRLRAEWQRQHTEYHGTLNRFGHGALCETLLARPIYDSTHIVGVLATHFSGNWAVAHLGHDFRKKGIGDRLAVALARNAVSLKAHDETGMGTWLCTHGWKCIARDGEIGTYAPPTVREDIRYAAAVCLVEPATRRVLLGKRKHSPWRDAWACPGGLLKSWEHAIPQRCAERELREETGIVLPHDLAPHMTVESVVGTRRGSFACDVKTYVFMVDAIPSYQPSDEIEPQVFNIDEAIATLPMGRGTKSTLRRIALELDRRTAPQSE